MIEAKHSAATRPATRPEPTSPTAEGETFLRGLIGAVTLLLVARAAEPLFFGESFYATLAIHPFWIVVILAAVQGGFFIGVATAAAAAMLMDWPPRPAGVDITAHYVELAIVPVQWLLAAIVIGGYRQGQLRREAWLAAENARLWEMSEDLAWELSRMDGVVAALELHAATREDGTVEVKARPGKDRDRALGDAGATEAGLAGPPMLPEAATPRRQVPESPIVETGAVEGRQVAIDIGDNRSATKVTPGRRPGPGEAGQDGPAASADGTSAVAAAETIVRTLVPAGGAGPALDVEPALDLGPWRRSA